VPGVFVESHVRLEPASGAFCRAGHGGRRHELRDRLRRGKHDPYADVLDIGLGRTVSGFEVLNPELFQRHELIHQGESANASPRNGACRGGCSTISPGKATFAPRSLRRPAPTRSCCRYRRIARRRGERLERDEGVRAQIDEAKMASLSRRSARRNGVITARIQARSPMVPPHYGCEQGRRKGRRFQTESALPRPHRDWFRSDDATHRRHSGNRTALKKRESPSRTSTGSSQRSIAAVCCPGQKKSIPTWTRSIPGAEPSPTDIRWARQRRAECPSCWPGWKLRRHARPQVMCIGHGQATATIIERI